LRAKYAVNIFAARRVHSISFRKTKLYITWRFFSTSDLFDISREAKYLFIIDNFGKSKIISTYKILWELIPGKTAAKCVEFKPESFASEQNRHVRFTIITFIYELNGIRM